MNGVLQHKCANLDGNFPRWARGESLLLHDIGKYIYELDSGASVPTILDVLRVPPIPLPCDNAKGTMLRQLGTRTWETMAL
jgi:hypothetical protein